MGNSFTKIAFTDAVKEVQELMGSRRSYARFEEGPDKNGHFTENEKDFLATRDSFYMASVSETGWPYVQHRGGPPGFIQVLSPTEFGMADFAGNRQYVSVGNLSRDDRAAFIFMDYPHQARLKILGHVRVIAVTGTVRSISLHAGQPGRFKKPCVHFRSALPSSKRRSPRSLNNPDFYPYQSLALLSN